VKILMLADDYPPLSRGGGRSVQLLSRELSRRGYEVIVCTKGHQDLPKYEQEDSVKIHRVQGFFHRIPFIYRGFHPPTKDWIIARRLRRIIQEERPDVIHAHGRMLYSTIALKRDPKIPLLATPRDYGFLCPKGRLLTSENVLCDEPFTKNCIVCAKDTLGLAKSLVAYYWIRRNRKKLKSVDKFTAISSFLRQVHMKHLGLSDKDIVMTPNFYSPQAESESQTKMGLPEDFILFVGALAPHKGVDLLIEAYYKLNAKTKLVVIGQKHTHYRYESTEDILVIEGAPHDAVMQAMSQCRFAVFPSVWPEPFGRVVLEAMSQKRTVIASRIGGFKDIVVDGETGIFVPPNNSAELAEAISYLLESPAKASEMGQRGYDRLMKTYTPEVVVPLFVDIYQSLISPQAKVA